jgi:DNA-binding transcriptional MerR regulator
MSRNGAVIGEVAKRTGASRKALRLYERAGILAARSGSASVWTKLRRSSRSNDPDACRVLAFMIW